jgi:hypothetical protein
MSVLIPTKAMDVVFGVAGPHVVRCDCSDHAGGEALMEQVATAAQFELFASGDGDAGADQLTTDRSGRRKSSGSWAPAGEDESPSTHVVLRVGHDGKSARRPVGAAH